MKRRTKVGRMGLLDTADWGTFKRAETWKAFGIAVVLFATIGYASLTLFGSMDGLLQAEGEAEPMPDVVFHSLNRTGIESGIVNETGWFSLADFRGDVIILDFMAHDCSNCHAVQAHLEQEMEGWHAMAEANGQTLRIIAYGAWYYEDLDYLNTSGGSYTVPLYPTGIGSETAAILDNGTADPVRLFTPSGTGAIPVVVVIDEAGYIVHRQNTGAPTDGWAGFDGAVEALLDGSGVASEADRIAWAPPKTSLTAVFALGALLSILVYFSPCAFPVLPGFISYYLSLGAREDELIEAGKLKTRMPRSSLIGLLAGLGMLTFFAFIGLLAAVMGEAFARSGIIHYIAIGVAILLIVLGSMMLVGVTSHLMGFVQKLVDRWSTTEADETFTPRRNMYLYGFGYAAASIDCTAAAVLPFVVFLATLGRTAVLTGLGGLMLGLLVLMIVVVMMVGLGRQVMVNVLRRATGTIKLVGSWMMIMAGVGLTLFLTNQSAVASVFG
jgi:cytochrome c-type biogenesis protein